MNRLYGHSQDLARVMPLIRQIRPEYWKVIDPTPGYEDELRTIWNPDPAQECYNLGVKLIVRHYGPWDNGNPAVVEPEQFTEDCRSQSWFPWAWAIETPNEPHVAAPLWMARCNEIFNSLGKECIVGNWGTGWDGYHVPGAIYYGCHEYGWPTISSQSGYHAGRALKWFPGILELNPDAKLFITEFGVTQAVEGREDTGWRSGDLTPYYYFGGLLDYTETAPWYVLGAFLFQIGGFKGWETFEVLGTPIEEMIVTLYESSPRFDLGFAAKAQELGYDIVGDPLSEETYIGDSLAYQVTSKGIMFYDKASNKVYFVSGR